MFAMTELEVPVDLCLQGNSKDLLDKNVDASGLRSLELSL